MLFRTMLTYLVNVILAAICARALLLIDIAIPSADVEIASPTYTYSSDISRPSPSLNDKRAAPGLGMPDIIDPCAYKAEYDGKYFAEYRGAQAYVLHCDFAFGTNHHRVVADAKNPCAPV